MIRFPCPACRATLKAPAERAGASTHCPYCRQPVQVPKIEIIPQAPSTADPWRTTAVLVEESQGPPTAMIRFQCPVCKQVQEVPDGMEGAKTYCRRCNQKLKIPGQPPPPPTNKTVLARQEQSPADNPFLVEPIRTVPQPWDRTSRSRAGPTEGLPPNRGVAVMVVGIISSACYLLCLLLFWPALIISLVMGLIAWVMGGQDLQGIKNGELDSEGKSFVLAGYICGMVTTILSIIGGVPLRLPLTEGVKAVA